MHYDELGETKKSLAAEVVEEEMDVIYEPDNKISPERVNIKNAEEESIKELSMPPSATRV